MTPEASLVTLVILAAGIGLFIASVLYKIYKHDKKIPDSWKTPEEMDYLLTDES